VRKLFATLALFCGLAVFAAEVIPPPPKQYFNDYAGVVSAATVDRLNRMLEDFERATSSQIIVAIFPKMQSDSSIEDYTFRVKEAWKVGQKGKDNGAALFVFVQDRKMFLQVGYGLEGALPDALAKRIIDDELAPRFKAGDYDGGLSAGVTAILAATKGEYQGNGQTAASGSHRGGVPVLFIVFGMLFLLVFLSRLFGRRGGMVYRSGGYSTFGGWGGGGWGGSGGGGWGGGGGGGGFSGGGGTGGGGGAGGSW
jgi:uncharacterized protein